MFAYFDMHIYFGSVLDVGAIEGSFDDPKRKNRSRRDAGCHERAQGRPNFRKLWAAKLYILFVSWIYSY